MNTALIVGVLGLVTALAFDRWYAGALIEREQQRVRALAAPYANSVSGYFARRTSRLAALRAFVESEPSMASIDADFPIFAEGLRSAALGVRAFQLVRDGRIIRTWPRDDERVLLDYDLTRHPSAEVREGLRRSMQTDSIVVSGAFRLLQGIDGLVLRQRMVSRFPMGPQGVAMVLELASLRTEVQFDSLPEGIGFALLDDNSHVVFGTTDLQQPTVTPVHVADVTWTVLMAPTEGWRDAVMNGLRATRAASALLWLLIMYLTATIVTRQRELTAAVADRTRDIERANEELRREAAERKALEEQLLHSQKMEAVGTLAGGVAHDFNNLLTAITGFAQLAEQQTVALQERPGGAVEREALQELRVDLTEILKASDRATLLTSQLLAFSRRQSVSLTQVDVNVVVQDLERMLRRLIGEHVSLVTDIATVPLPVLADSGHISQVIVNLVVNARDALPRGGNIHIATRAYDSAGSSSEDSTAHDKDNIITPAGGTLRGIPAGAWVVLTVSDDGVGMSPEVMSRMFEPFFTTKHIGGGTGLGLSTVYGIVTQAGGQVLADSAPGAGTRITVVLPRMQVVTNESAQPAQPEGSARGEQVLIVEDEAGLRRLVSEVLRRRGYRVLVASDGVEALAILSTAGPLPDLVLTDVVMPRMGGPELAAAMRERGLSMPVLFMSGYQDGEIIPEDGRYGYIGKPFTPDALVERVRQVLRG